MPNQPATPWRNIFREFLDWCKAEKNLDINDLQGRWHETLMKAVTARIKAGAETNPRKARADAAKRFRTHSNICLWGGENGAHRRISPRNYFIFDDPLVAQFNRGRAPAARLTIANYIANTPASTQNVGKRKRAPKRKAGAQAVVADR